MKRIHALFAAIVVFAVSFVAWGQPLADRIPQDAVVYIGWSGSESMGPLYAESHLKAVIEASNIRELIDQSIPRLLENMGHQDQDAAVVTSFISAIGGPMWRHPSAIYFGGVDVTNPDFPMPKLAILCDAGKEGKELVAQLDKLFTRKGQPVIPYRSEEQDGLVVVVFGNVEISASKKPVIALSAARNSKRRWGSWRKIRSQRFIWMWKGESSRSIMWWRSLRRGKQSRNGPLCAMPWVWDHSSELPGRVDSMARNG